MSEAPRGDARERLTALEEKLRALERELLAGASEGAPAGRDAATAVAEPPARSSPAPSSPPPSRPSEPAGQASVPPPSATRAEGAQPRARRGTGRKWPWLLLLAAIVAGFGVAVWATQSGDDEADRDAGAPTATGSAVGEPGPSLAVTVAGDVPPRLRAVLPAGATIVPAASERAALAAVCDGRADAAALGPSRAAGRGEACSLRIAAAVPTSATVLLAPRGGCVGPRRARRLAAAPGRLDARRERAATAARTATRRRLRDALSARRDAAARRAAAAARARFDARRNLAPVAVRAADGRCIAPTRGAIAGGTYPLGGRAAIVAAAPELRRVATTLRPASRAPVRTRTVAVGALP